VCSVQFRRDRKGRAVNADDAQHNVTVFHLGGKISSEFSSLEKKDIVI
jgi:hypothetical protein